jgi:hypothetical protein
MGTARRGRSLVDERETASRRASAPWHWRSLRDDHHSVTGNFGSNIVVMEHRGVRYAIRIGIAREQWRVAIYPPGNRFPIERAVVGPREEAELVARAMINA